MCFIASKQSNQAKLIYRKINHSSHIHHNINKTSIKLKLNKNESNNTLLIKPQVITKADLNYTTFQILNSQHNHKDLIFKKNLQKGILKTTKTTKKMKFWRCPFG
jgi:hypothetical protein